MINPARIPTNVKVGLRRACASRLEGLRNDRLSWWAHWATLASMYLPRRYRWFVTPNVANRGSAQNGQIVDETGVLAARTLSTGLLANLTSPTKQWFRIGIMGLDPEDNTDEAIWLDECTKRMLEVLAGSNFYNTIGTNWHELGVFGSSALLQYEDPQTVVRFYNPCLGEFFFGLGADLTVDTLYREYTYTVSQVVQEFGLENVSQSVKIMFETGGGSLSKEVVICHAVEPNRPVWMASESYGLPLADRFPFREVYWEQAGSNDSSDLLRVGGFLEKPFVGMRWDVTSNDAYGRSPGMDALPAVLQLQIEQRRKAEAIDKMVRPPMVGSLALRNETANILPGGVTYVADPQANGFKPAFTVEPRIGELMEDLKEVQSRVLTLFFNDLFRGRLDDTKVQSATWVDAAEQEKLLLLGPVVERSESEGLDEIIKRLYNIMKRRNLLPPPPPSLAKIDITVEYISILATAQRAAATAAIERVLQVAGGVVAVAPGVMDNIDTDEAIRIYADQLNFPAEAIRAMKDIVAIRQNRQAQEHASAMLTTGATLAAGAKTLSETQVGGGQSALQKLLA